MSKKNKFNAVIGLFFWVAFIIVIALKGHIDQMFGAVLALLFGILGIAFLMPYVRSLNEYNNQRKPPNQRR